MFYKRSLKKNLFFTDLVTNRDLKRYRILSIMNDYIEKIRLGPVQDTAEPGDRPGRQFCMSVYNT